MTFVSAREQRISLVCHRPLTPDFARLITAGLGIGGAWGFKEGFSRPLGNNTSFKLRLNSVLNGCTRRGTFVGNSLGVLGRFPQPLQPHTLTVG